LARKTGQEFRLWWMEFFKNVVPDHSSPPPRVGHDTRRIDEGEKKEAYLTIPSLGDPLPKN